MNGQTAEIAAFDAVMVAAYRALAERSGGEAIERDGVLLARGPHPNAIVANTAMRLNPAAAPGPALRSILEHYAPTSFDFALVTRAGEDDDLAATATAAGWRQILPLPGMVIRDRLRTPEPIAGVRLRRVEAPEDRASFGRLAGLAFSDHEQERAGIAAIFEPQAMFEPGGWPGVIAALDGEDASVGGAFVGDGAAVVGWIATPTEFQRRGLGRLVTTVVTNAAFDAGATLVTLQASPQGRPVYERMGYETIRMTHLWVAPPPVPATG